MEVGWGGSFFPWLLLKGFFSFPRIFGLPLLLWEKCLGAKSGKKKKKEIKLKPKISQNTAFKVPF